MDPRGNRDVHSDGDADFHANIDPNCDEYRGANGNADRHIYGPTEPSWGSVLFVDRRSLRDDTLRAPLRHIG